MPGTHPADLGVAELARRVRVRDVTSLDLVEACLDRIATRDPALRAMSEVLAHEARDEARERDASIREGTARGPLHGVPVVVKQDMDVAGHVTTHGTAAQRTPAGADSVMVRRLREAGAVILGKTNEPEFGQWPFTESRAHGITRNPWDTRHTPGGSSGGTAVAVAAGMVPAGLGTDGGGSIRIPSACCGLFGLKAQRGRVSFGPRPEAWYALGHAGPLTRSVLDSALVYDAIRGNVDGDTYRAGEPATSFTHAARSESGRLRVGWSTGPPPRAWDPTSSPRAPCARPRSCWPGWATTYARWIRGTRTSRPPSSPSTSPAWAPRRMRSTIRGPWSRAPAGCAGPPG